jgi:alpha-beta hydrolase superfamily lysophospholipase
LLQSEDATVTGDGAVLWTRTWRPESRPLRGHVVLVHGLGEHSGRYDSVALRLAGAGFSLRAFDLRGHGRSSGRRGDTRLEPALADLERLRCGAAAESPGLPIFLYGHSLGALIVLTALVRRRPGVSGAVVSAPPLRNALRRQTAKVLLARALGALLPGITLPTGLDPEALSRDPAVTAAYRADPLVHDRGSLGLARDSLAATVQVEAATTLGAPVLVVHGSADRIAFVEGSRALAARLPGTVTLREHAGLFHEPHNEPERELVLAEIAGWLDARSAACGGHCAG